MNKTILNIISESISVKEKTKELAPVIEKIAKAAVKCYRSGGKIVLFGNGGSAADCQHLAAELVCRFEKNRKSFPAIALTTDTSLLTAVSNDYGFDKVFSRQVESMVSKGDLAIAISTSGNSKNVVSAAKQAKKQGAFVVGFTGSRGGRLKTACDLTLAAPSDITARIQETHIMASHIICKLIENELS